MIMPKPLFAWASIVASFLFLYNNHEVTAFQIAKIRFPLSQISSNSGKLLNSKGSASRSFRNTFCHDEKANVDILHEKDSNRSQMVNRIEFVQRLMSVSILNGLYSPKSMAFDGGVGGLGKTRPETGVIFRNSDISSDDNKAVGGGMFPNAAGGDITVELLAPDDDETPVILSFHAPWPMSRSAAGIESRDLTNPEGAYVQVTNIPKSLPLKRDDSGVVLPTSFFVDALFGPKGKYGMYGTPTDVKVKKLPAPTNSLSSTSLYSASFTTLTPAMRESERKAYIATSIVGNTVFMLVTGTTSTRFKSQNDLLLQTAKGFTCVPAPKSNLRTR